MNTSFGHVIAGIIFIFLICLTGCVAPPIEPGIKMADNYTPYESNPALTIAPVTPVYVTIETPYVTPGPVSVPSSTPPAYTTLLPLTPIPEDYVVIYSTKDQPFSYNKSAVSFNLKNPPMLIDFDLSVAMVTRNIEGKSRVLSNQWTSMSVENYDPYAFFEVTVREKSTGKIVLQDGFGQSKQYGTEIPRHLKLLRGGEYLIEFDGNDVLASINLSVKRQGNINQSIV
jgi:hypothetical protein